MITAIEARELVSQSVKSIDLILSKIDENIRALAKEGKSTFDCKYLDHSLCYSGGPAEHLSYHVAINNVEYGYAPCRSYQVIKATPLQQKIMEKLIDLGYRVTIEKGKPYVPRANEDDADPVKFVHLFLRISW